MASSSNMNDFFNRFKIFEDFLACLKNKAYLCTRRNKESVRLIGKSVIAF